MGRNFGSVLFARSSCQDATARVFERLQWESSDSVRAALCSCAFVLPGRLARCYYVFMAPRDLDTAVRLAAFQFLEEQVRFHGEVLPLDVLRQGYFYDGVQVPLVSPQGIFKPKVLSVPLSITTVPPSERKPRPYDDGVAEDGTIYYKYRGTNPRHTDNVGLRTARERKIPLVYFHGIIPGRYLAVWPVFIVGEDSRAQTFTVMPDDHVHVIRSLLEEVVDFDTAADQLRRAYRAAVVRQRLHQGAFRDRVIAAYRTQCAICKLRHQELLDAAHIISDADVRGEPNVSNGLSLCKLHHAAFDRNIVGIRPDLVIEVRPDIMLEEDGPMLRHGLQGFHGRGIYVPRRQDWKPDKNFLEERYEMFRKAG